MKKLILILIGSLIFAGCITIGHAEENESIYSMQVKAAELIKKLAENQARMEAQISLLNEKDRILSAMTNACPGGWENYTLRLRDYHNNVFDDWITVEICKENGLLRLRKRP